MPYRKPFKTRGGIPVVIDSGDFPSASARRWLLAGLGRLSARARQARAAEGRFLGIGVANFVELTGRGPVRAGDGAHQRHRARCMSPSSAAAMGQGTKTMLAQIVAEQLGGDMANVIVTTGDTAASATGFGGFGSRQPSPPARSAHAAAAKVRDKALAVAGHMLEVCRA